MKALLAYGVASAALLAGLGAGVVALFPGAETAAVWTGAIIAWAVQVAAFGALVVGRGGIGFTAAWAGGTALRFAAVGAAALWVTRVGSLDPASLLVSLVGFMFGLVLLEPLFLRLAD
ncbi:MAG: hypothetical protein P8177_03665 [Gemmatimonadota bacterium]